MNSQNNFVKKYIIRRYSIDELESILNQKLNNQSRNLKHYANKSLDKFMNIVIYSITDEILEQLTDGWVEDSPIPEKGLYEFIQEIFGERIIKKYDELRSMNLQESIRRILREEVKENDLIVYHGTPEKHEFNKEGLMFNGTFFSISENEAKSYGEYIYRVFLRRNLNLIDTNLLKDCELIIDEFGTLIDPYYDEDEDDYYITEPEQLYYNSDSWSAIEANDDVMEWLEGNYDGIWIYEGGVRNLLLFKPIKEKIERIELI